jgi:hypothetical protein
LEIHRVAGGAVESSNPPRLLVGLSARQRAMHKRLYDFHVKLVSPVSDAGMACVLRDLRAAPELQSFRIWLVGSRLQPGRDGSDIDVVLSPRPGTWPRDHVIETALWFCREYGLYGATPACVIDPCFRVDGPTVDRIPLRPEAAITTVKLMSPKLADLLARGRIRECRRLGDLAIEFVRRAEHADYYRKLPRADFDGSRWPYLRPAIEIDPAEDGELLHRIPHP